MKLKRFISSFLAASMFVSVMPQISYAAAGSAIVSDVINVEGKYTTHSRHITYKFNGVTTDSLEMGPDFNLKAYNLMDEKQKEQVARWMCVAGYEARREQFGEDGAKILMKKYNDVTGWSEAAKILEQRIQNKYAKELVEFYGSDDINDPDKFFNKELRRLVGTESNYDNEPDANIRYLYLNSRLYADYPEYDEFRRRVDAIADLMDTGKEAYDCLTNNMVKATRYAMQGSSKELISLICDKVLVPAITPSSEISTLGKEIFSAVLELGDRATNLSGELTDMVIGKAVDGETAGKEIKYLTEMAEKDYEIAKYCHDQAVYQHDLLVQDAPGLIEYLNSQIKAKEAAVKESITPETELADKIYDIGTYNGDSNYGNTYDYLKGMVPKYGDNAEQQTAAYNAAYKNAYLTILAEQEKLGETMYNDILAMYEQDNVAVHHGSVTDEDINLGECCGIIFADTYNSGYIGKVAKIYNASGAEVDINEVSYIAIPHGYCGTDEEYADTCLAYETKKAFYEKQLDELKKLNEDCTKLAEDYDQKFDATYKKIKELDSCVSFVYITPETLAEIDAARKNMKYNSSSHDKLLFKGVAGYTQVSTICEIQKKLDIINTNFENIKANYDHIIDDVKQATLEYEKAIDDYLDRCEEYNEIVDEEEKFLDENCPDYLRSGFQSYITEAVEKSGDPDKFKQDEAKKLSDFCEEYIEFETRRSKAMDRMSEAEDTVSNYISSYHPYMFHPGYSVSCTYYTNDTRVIEMQKNIKYSTYGVTNAVFAERARDCMAKFNGITTAKINALNYVAQTKAEKGNIKRSIVAGGATAYAPYKSALENFKTNVPDVAAQTQELLDELGKVAEDPDSYTPVEGIEKNMPEVEIDGESFDLSMSEGQTRQLKVTLTPENATDKGIIWESLTPWIATVNSNGRVTALANGTAIIRARAEDCECETADPLTELETYDITPFTGSYVYLPQYVAEFKISVNDLDNPIPPEEQTPEFRFGDVDTDNAITASDSAFILQKALVRTFKLPIEKETDNWFEYADVDHDNDITASDSAFILQKALVGTFKLPIEKET